MVRPVMKDIFFLNQKSEPATKADKQVAEDLLDTLKANEAGCVGMAANMIGVKKRIIVVSMGFAYITMINPVIVKKFGAYETEEGCLSLVGVRRTTRYKDIEVDFQDLNFKKQHQKYSGWIAQIIQHEIDHCEGIVI
ncbi:peptide deformylase [Anaerocolumna sp. AGMB13025]|uniref:peptide deformylase n=1 Tax=Anaerocolumna sp. AGMB13025 TaxID=3039116 RepID=UPI00241E5680|nr:peptide deformylase [Anaerocolumna sp. AGMB13025]WFR60153.1 peptide deformylase [Anaerocolumna sp. AGMB13025]